MPVNPETAGPAATENTGVGKEKLKSPGLVATTAALLGSSEALTDFQIALKPMFESLS